MIVCSCNVLTDTEIKDIVNSKTCPRTPGAVYKCLGCSPSCGRCIATLKAIINESFADTASTGASCPASLEIDAAALCSA
jgi:bacterioferritin-associated ferredoxin